MKAIVVERLFDLIQPSGPTEPSHAMGFGRCRLQCCHQSAGTGDPTKFTVILDLLHRQAVGDDHELIAAGHRTSITHRVERTGALAEVGSRSARDSWARRPYDCTGVVALTARRFGRWRRSL